MNFKRISLFGLLRNMVSIILLMIQVGCNNAGKTTIKGEFPEFIARMVQLSEIVPQKNIPMDTIKVSSKGTFTFHIKRDSAGIYLLKFDNRNYITLVLDKESEIRVSSSSKNIRSAYQVQGSPDSESLLAFEKYYDRNRQKIDSITAIYSKSQTSQQLIQIKRDLDITYNRIFEEQRREVISFITSNCNSLASLLVLDKRFGQRKVLAEDSDYVYYFRLDSCLSLKYPGNRHVLDFHAKVKKIREDREMLEYRNKRLAVGNKVPDITLQDTKGKDVPLSSLKGRNVIIYFWASWDPSSRKANPDLVKFMTEFKNKNLVIYAISLDSYVQMWEDAIKSDNLSGWTHVSDLMNVYSGALTLFNVPKKFPYYYLLDTNMLILYKGGDLQQLANRLKTLQK